MLSVSESPVRAVHVRGSFNISSVFQMRSFIQTQVSTARRIILVPGAYVRYGLWALTGFR